MPAVSVKTLVLVGGGFADAAGFAAALALGADGVRMGTRFVVTGERPKVERGPLLA